MSSKSLQDSWSTASRKRDGISLQAGHICLDLTAFRIQKEVLISLQSSLYGKGLDQIWTVLWLLYIATINHIFFPARKKLALSGLNYQI